MFFNSGSPRVAVPSAWGTQTYEVIAAVCPLINITVAKCHKLRQSAAKHKLTRYEYVLPRNHQKTRTPPRIRNLQKKNTYKCSDLITLETPSLPARVVATNDIIIIVVTTRSAKRSANRTDNLICTSWLTAATTTAILIEVLLQNKGTPTKTSWTNETQPAPVVWVVIPWN